MTKIEHEVIVDIFKLQQNVLSRILEVEATGIGRVTSVCIHPKTWQDIVTQPSFRHFARFHSRMDGTAIFGVKVICNSDMEEMTFDIVVSVA